MFRKIFIGFILAIVFMMASAIALDAQACDCGSITLSGRVMNAYGSPIRSARLVFYPQYGTDVPMTYSSAFGYYSIQLDAGMYYAVQISAKGHTFLPQVMVFYWDDQRDFYAEP